MRGTTDTKEQSRLSYTHDSYTLRHAADKLSFHLAERRSISLHVGVRHAPRSPLGFATPHAPDRTGIEIAREVIIELYNFTITLS